MQTLFKIFPQENATILGAILLLPLLGAFVNGVFGKRLGRDAVRLMGLGVMGTAFALALTAFAMLHHAHHEIEHAGGHEVARLSWEAWRWVSISLKDGVGATAIDVGFALDPLNGIMLLVITGIGFLIHLYSSSYMWEDPGFYRFFAYLNLFIFSMLVLVLGDSLPLLFVGWEGVGLCSYLLIGFWFGEDKNATAGKKAFIANRVGDFGLLVGMAMLLYYTGSLSFLGIHGGAEGLLQKVTLWQGVESLPPFLKFLSGVPFFAQKHEAYAATVCGLALFLGCAGKSAQIPLYVWLPDAMAGPTPVSALIHAATMVTAGVYLVCRLSPVFVLSPTVMTVVATTGVLTAIFAASIGLVQHDIKKVLAYSTVSQLGFMFIGVGVGAFTDGFFHVLTHAFFKACLFLGAGSVIHSMHAQIHDSDASQDMRNMGGLRKYMPITHATYLVSCLAIAGVPGFSGFFSKDEILAKAFEHAVKVGKPDMWTPPAYWGTVIFAVGIFAATMTAFYMFRTYFLTFWGEFKGWAIVGGGHGHGHDDHDHDDHDDHGHDDHGHDHHASFEPGTGRDHLSGAAPHESPWQMWVPLAVLAAGAALAGYLNAPIISDKLTWLHHWLHPVFADATKNIDEHAHHANTYLLAGFGVAAAAVGIGIAYYVYVMEHGEPVKKLAQQVPGFHQLLLDKWRVDEAYEASVIGAVDELAQSAVIADKWVVDGILAKLTALVTAGAGHVLRLLQTGRVQVYGAVMMVGVVAVGWFLWTPHPDASITTDPKTGNFKVTAAPGVGYRYKWDANGDGKADTETFSPDLDSVEVKIEPGQTKTVTLWVVNSFRRVQHREFQLTAPRRDATGVPTMEDFEKMKKQLDVLQEIGK